jgi:MarR family transcriptional regulator for hemolysin
MKLAEPISRKLMLLGKACLGVLNKRLNNLDINRNYYVLASIYFNDGPLTQKALAKILGKDKSSMVNIIDELTATGYAYRETNPADRREHLIKLTQKAIDAVPQITQSFDFLNTTITKNISAADMKVFNSVLQKMENNIKPFLTPPINIETKPTEPIRI